MKGPMRKRYDRKNRVRKRRVVGRIYGMKYSRKDYKDRNRYRNGVKRNGQARLVYITSPPREGEPAGTLTVYHFDPKHTTD